MKCFVPEISWHNRDPVYSLDIQAKGEDNRNFYRLASGGADSHVVIWHVTPQPEDESGQFASFECAADLQRHQKSVNIVRFSPNGVYLASADDDGVIIVWKMRLDQDPPELLDEHSEKDKETWITLKILRGHLQDIYALAWSPDSVHLVSGSIDNTAILWNSEKGKKLEILGDHKGFVQGVAWDPKGKYIATLSTDRMLRVFNASKRKLVGRCSKTKLPWVPAKEKSADKENKCETKSKDEKEKLNKMFHNDTLKTFTRRLNFSPNGELLITPCGVIEDDGTITDATYIFTRSCFSKPACHLPSPGQYTVAVRCCPVVYKLRGSKPSLFALPYRIVYAIATRSTVVLYDTEQTEPFGFVSNIHYTGLTDITWSPDGRLVVISSSEGYCSVITFDENEIGIPYVKEGTTVASTENSAGSEEPGKPFDADKDTVKSFKNINITDQKTNTNECCENIEKECGKNENGETSVETMEVDLAADDANPLEKLSSGCSAVEMTPEKADNTSCVDLITPEKEEFDLNLETPKKSDYELFKAPDGVPVHTTPMKLPDFENNDSQCSELSLIIDGDESELISKEEQARRLMSPFRGSPKQESPNLKRTPKADDTSPRTPKSGRRVSLITLSSPKTKRKL